MNSRQVRRALTRSAPSGGEPAESRTSRQPERELAAGALQGYEHEGTLDFYLPAHEKSGKRSRLSRGWWVKCSGGLGRCTGGDNRLL